MTGRHINLSVARACFVRCPACYNHFGKPNHLVPSNTILAFLTFAQSHGFDRVTLCGGDPLSRPDILELLAEIRLLGLGINLDTVGTPLLGASRTIFFGDAIVQPLDASRIAELVDLIGIPVDGSSSAVVGQFRTGRPDLLEEQVEILRLLDTAGANICVNTVVHRGNAMDLCGIWHRIEVFPHVAKWQLFQFSPSGPLGFRNRGAFEISADTFAQARRELEAHLPESHPPTIEFKSNSSRDGAYMLVDSEGHAWIPDASTATTAAPGRRVLGSIRQQQDWPSIVDFALHE